MAEIIGIDAPATEAQVLQFETQIGAVLPREYRNFLLTYNGGNVSPTCFRFHDKAYGDAEIRTLWSLGGVPYGLETVRNNLVEQGLLPAGMVCIGEDAAGNGIGIICLGDNYGKIVYFDYGKAFDKIYVISESFQQFIDKLHEPQPYVKDEIGHFAANNDLINVARLIDEGWNINQPTQSGLTIIESSAMRQQKELVGLLLDRGAKIGRSLEFAIKLRNSELIDLIRSYEDKN